MAYRTTRDIVIPAGTVLERASDQHGGKGYVEEIVALGPNFTGTFLVQVHPDARDCGFLVEMD